MTFGKFKIFTFMMMLGYAILNVPALARNAFNDGYVAIPLGLNVVLGVIGFVGMIVTLTDSEEK